MSPIVAKHRSRNHYSPDFEGASFYWYDLETTGTNPASDRIIQFAGMRTDLDLQPIEEPYVTYVQMPVETLPSIEATLVTGISPQQTFEKGIPEIEAIKQINARFMVPNTCVVGYNNLRFDDEFIRYTLYRNLMDPYAREWSAGNSRWDLIDLVRATNALRPNGIQWPINDEGLPKFSLEALSQQNGLLHENAHDALSDVMATIELARLIKKNQPDIWTYALANRSKQTIRKLLEPLYRKPCVYVSGFYPNRQHCLAPVLPVAFHPKIDTRIIVCDLRGDLDFLINGTVDEIKKTLFEPSSTVMEKHKRVPLSEVRVNRCPFIAPLAVIREADAQRLEIDFERVKGAHRDLLKVPNLEQKIASLFSEGPIAKTRDVEEMLYERFIPKKDRLSCESLHSAISSGQPWPDIHFEDARLGVLATRLKCRTRPDELSVSESYGYFSWLKTRLEGGKLNIESFRSEIESRVREEGPRELFELLWEYAEQLDVMIEAGMRQYG